MKSLQVVVIGAGSASFGRGTIADLMACDELREFDLTVSLVDIDEAALDRMCRFAGLLKEHTHSPARIEATTDRREVLADADYVIVSVAKNRWQLWEKDFYIPAAYGFRHVFGETAGPGAAFHTLRSLELVVPMAQDMEALCPDALLINFTNPESRVCLGVTQLTPIRTVGLCHGPFSTLDKICEVLGRPEEAIDLTVGGINHFHWALQIRSRPEGEDLYPEFHEKMKQSDWGLDPLIRRMYDLFGYLTYPAASHPGEYVGFGHEIGGPLLINWGIGQVSRRLGAKASEYSYVIEGRPHQPSYELWSMEQADRIQRIAEGRDPLTEEFARPTRELAIPIICDIELDRDRKELSVNIPNENFAVSNLPEDAVVEIPARVDGEGVHPIAVGALPEALAGVCNLQISIQKLLVEAYRQRSKRLLLQALVIDPIVESADRAERMMEHMLEVEADYLPELH
jgi:alpha-galactosidase